MLVYPFIDPVIVNIGPLSLHWYGMMYVFGLVGAYLISTYRIKHTYYKSLFNKDSLSDMIFYAMLGVVIGGRMGYVLFYNFGLFLDNPLWIFKVWEGGMSFHGGMLGVATAVFIFGKKHNISAFTILDFIAPVSALGLFFGRIGNFIGGELYGRATDLPWGVIFPHAGDFARHPSQLYEAILEGLVLATILFAFSRKPRPIMSVSGLLVGFYGLFRFIVEFAREPDQHLGFIAFGWLTMGQVLSSPMIILGCIMVWYAYKNKKYPTTK